MPDSWPDPPPADVPRDDLRHARQPNSRIVGICLDCGPLEDVGGVLQSAGMKRFLNETGHCVVCGSAATIVPNAVRELKHQLKLRQKRDRREMRKRGDR